MKAKGTQGIFRLRFFYWLVAVILPPLGVGGWVLVEATTRPQHFSWPLLAILFGLYCLVILLPALRAYVSIDNRGISFVGRYPPLTGPNQVNIPWSEVIVAECCGMAANQPYLVLGTEQGITLVPLVGFDVAGIWRGVQEWADPEALKIEAYTKLPGYKEWVGQNISSVRVLRPLYFWEKRNWAIGWIGGAFCTIATAATWNDPWWLGLTMMIFAVISWLMLLSSGPIEMDAISVTEFFSVGATSTPWKQVQRVEITQSAMSMIFYGEGLRQRITAPASWPSRQQKAAMALIETVCRLRGIDLKCSADSQFILSLGERGEKNG